MTDYARGTFAVTAWDEEVTEDFGEGGRLTRVRLTQLWRGDLVGEATGEWLMAYKPDGSADIVGRQRLEGTVGELNGVIVMEVVGWFDGRVTSGDLTVVTGCGAGPLRRIKGAGRFEAELGPEGTWDLDYAVIDEDPPTEPERW